MGHRAIRVETRLGSPWLWLSLVAGMPAAATAAAPTLYTQPAYQSPVNAGPDDLLMLAGYGLSANDTVVYQRLRGAVPPTAAPALVPPVADADLGVAPVVSVQAVPYALTIRLPGLLHADQPYALWVRSSNGEWSAPVRINDARPLWLTPAVVYASAALAGLPRELKVVGRNLAPSATGITHVRLSGPQTLVLSALEVDHTLDRYVARVKLPARLAPGRYAVAVERGDFNWAELPDQQLDVRPDPRRLPEYFVGEPRFGGCRPDDGRDDTSCVLAAIAAARSGGSGIVRFGTGSWDLIDGSQPGVVGRDGIIVPRGISLRGTGRDRTRLVRHPGWSTAALPAVFSLDGENTVSGFTFQDAQVYTPESRVGPFLQLGENSESPQMRAYADSATAQDIVITDNRFDRTQVAISDGGFPIERLFVTYNEFGTYSNELELAGNAFNMQRTFRVDDSVVSHNVFKPGSFMRASDRAGPIASEIGASHRLDFSENNANGASADYLYSALDPHGWGEGFFFHMNGNHELLLISQNAATCTGDRIGDGAAIAFDNNGNTWGLDDMRTVLAADSGGVTVAGPLLTKQNGRDVPIERYYIGHWVQVGAGPGLGQARRITGYDVDPASGKVTLHVAPNWDVVPEPGGTRVAVGREFWQAYVIDNRIDQRAPCLKSNRSRPAGGEISIWAQATDSVVAGNQQFDTDGIVFQLSYIPSEHPCPQCAAVTFFQTFLDYHDNLIDGRYDRGSDCSSSGITGWASAAPWGSSTPPTLGFGISVAHNTLRGAENALGGAISVSLGWHSGPPPHQWPILDNLLIQHNSVLADGTAAGRPGCGPGHGRTGISFPAGDLVVHSVLYGNSCVGIPTPLGRMSRQSTRVCPAEVVHSCECLMASP